MTVVAWILQGLLALVFLSAGATKLIQGRAKLISSGQDWAETFSDASVRGIGAVEVLGALGLVLPALTGIAPVLTPIAAVGLALVMVGAVILHLRRGEYAGTVPSAVLGLLSIAVAILRFGVVG